MRSLSAFFKKELTEHLRTGKITILGALFVLFGIMNPAVAKLTPWLLEMMAESMAESGMVIIAAPVTAMDSWVQFFKNIPMALIAFVLIEGAIFTKEYQSGTLVLSLTKGLPRYHVVLAKSAVLLLLWTVGYWLCFGITYGYNAYFWDNSVAQSLMSSVLFWWVFGVWVIALLLLSSAVSQSSSGVLLGVGGAALVSMMLGLIPKLGKYLPTKLTDGTSLIYGTAAPEDYLTALILAAIMAVLCFALSIAAFDRKQL